MAKNETRRLSPAQIQANKTGWAPVKANASYKPAKEEFSVEKVEAALKAMTTAQEEESKAEAAAAAARDVATAAEWAFHNKMLGVKKQVVALFGEDSNEVQAVGLKKKSEYKRPPGRKPRQPPQN